jgi:DNA-binding NarL/FixJ family response regulator
MKTNVLLVDGRKLTREGLEVLLAKHADIDVVGEADDPQAAVKLARAVSAHVVVHIVTVLTQTAVDLIRSVRAGRGDTKVIVLLNHSDPSVIREVFEAGASGCLTRECASEELVTAIRTVRGGKTYLSPRVADSVVTN